MSARFPFPTKWNPLWWLGNVDNPPPPGYSRSEWWMRNPLHNLAWYVIGCADRRFRLIGPAHRSHVLLQFWPPFICPFLVIERGRFYAYIGWRHDGPFGARVTWR